MKFVTAITGDCAAISVKGNFQFESVNKFLEAAEPLARSSTGTRIDVDLSAARYLDSSALGGLLRLREVAREHGKEVSLSNAPEEIRKMLDIANFGKLFKIVP